MLSHETIRLHDKIAKQEGDEIGQTKLLLLRLSRKTISELNRNQCKGDKRYNFAMAILNNSNPTQPKPTLPPLVEKFNLRHKNKRSSNFPSSEISSLNKTWLILSKRPRKAVTRVHRLPHYYHLRLITILHYGLPEKGFTCEGGGREDQD